MAGGWSNDNMSRTYKVDWETDGEVVDLPETIELPDSISAEDAADYLSDKYGWLIKDLTRTWQP